jgi:hypothetical protein
MCWEFPSKVDDSMKRLHDSLNSKSVKEKFREKGSVIAEIPKVWKKNFVKRAPLQPKFQSEKENPWEGFCYSRCSKVRKNDSVGTFSGPTSTRRSSLQRLHAVPVRPVWVTGKTGVAGRSDERATNVARAGSRRGGAHRVVLGSAGQLGRLQTSRRWRKNSMIGLEK